MCEQIDRNKYIETFFDYSISDVRHLLEDFKKTGRNERRHAGPLLMTIMSGIDALGGIIYGFNMKPTRRSVCFMQDYMKIKRGISEFIYDSIRCGIFHHGMPKTGIRYELWYDDEWKINESFCRDSKEETIVINVAKLAKQYLEIVYNIKADFNKDPNKFRADGLESWIDRAKNSFRPAFDSVCTVCAICYGESSSSAESSSKSSSASDSARNNVGSGNVEKPIKPVTPGEMP